VRALEVAGLPRYPFTGDGLVAAARALVDHAPRHRLVAGRALPPLGALSSQLMVWAATAACVPDASWAQIEAIRRRFDGFAELGPPIEPRGVERLLQWVAAEGHGAGVVGEGAGLYLSAADRRALCARLREFDRRRWPDEDDRERRFEARARRLFIAQLEAADLDHAPYEAALRDLKIAVHHAILEPELARELLPGFADRAVAYELRELVDDELAVQATGATLAGTWSAGHVEALQGYVRGRGAARLRDLLRVPRGRRQLGALAGLVALAATSWGVWWQTRDTTLTREHTVVVEVPPTWRVVSRGQAGPVVAPVDAEPAVDGPAPPEPVDVTDVNAKWCTRVVAPMHARFAGRYPLDAGSQLDARIADFKAFFDPQRGAIRKARKELLAGHVTPAGKAVELHNPGSPRLDPAVLRFLDRAHDIGALMLVDGELRVDFELEVACAPQVSKIDVTIEGTKVEVSSCDNASPAPLRWPGEDEHGATLVVHGRQGRKTIPWPGDWGLFKLLERPPSTLFPFAGGRFVSVRFDLADHNLGVVELRLRPVREGSGAAFLGLPALIRDPDVLPPARLFTDRAACKRQEL
jgi:hypothetical protein